MDSNDIAKECPTCGVVKLFQDFHKNRIRSDGLHRECRACRKGEGKVRASERNTFLPIEPLREALTSYLVSHEIQLGHFAAEAGVSVRLIHRVLHQSSKAPIRTADKICIAMDRHLNDLYPQK